MSFGYDSNGNVNSITDRMGNTSLLGYDSQGILNTSVTDPAGHLVSYTFDKNHRLTGITYADGSRRTFSYNCCSPTGVTDENGHRTTLVSNSLLQPVSITDALSNTTSYQYDNTNSLVKIVKPDGTAITVSPDKLYRPASVTNEVGGTVSVTYDGNWKISSLTDERGNKTDLAYMDLLPLSVTDALGSKTQTFWDGSGRLAFRLNARNDTVSYQYTADSQLAKKDTAGSVNASYSYDYDSTGNMIMMRDAGGDTVLGYDPEGGITSLTYPDTISVGFGHNSIRKLASLTYPDGGSVISITYAYDTRNRLQKITWSDSLHQPLSVILGYDPAGNLVSESRSNSTSSTYAYDARNLLSSVEHTGPAGVFFSSLYKRDPVGRIVAETTSSPLPAAPPVVAVSSTYNAVNQMLTRGADTYSYDADGNTMGITASTNVLAGYDPENRLVTLTRGGSTTTYSYNAVDQRVKVVAPGQTTNSHYDPDGRLLLQTDQNGQIIAYYIYAGRRPVAGGTPSGGYYFYHYDNSGNTVALTAEAGTVAAAYAYSPFGEVTAKTGVLQHPFTYGGALGIQDDGNGLYFMRSRYYDAASGRFIQKDPIGFRGGTNLYTYVDNNPVVKADPEGTSWQSWGLGLVAGAGTLALVANPVTLSAGVTAGLVGFAAKSLYELGEAGHDLISTMHEGIERSKRELKYKMAYPEKYQGSGGESQDNMRFAATAKRCAIDGFNLKVGLENLGPTGVGGQLTGGQSVFVNTVELGVQAGQSGLQDLVPDPVDNASSTLDTDD